MTKCPAPAATGPVWSALNVRRKSDDLAVWKLDRRGRSVKELVQLVSDLEKRGVHFRSVTDAIYTSDPTGRFFFFIARRPL